ncbi:ATP-binding protein [Paractinoplanes lichenicola]|uniref:Sensor-like histidine kinase SenX3 n=1 Tax=Paractinoplanes lichenicola TaxID=2802976 RepID=A0ABS1VZA6_9ACTN|nr:ATP-binding protein [Actinoplanes lichenicola]MBL7259782.1 PAS domain S-box protein [Actinoplanes lichenicola]
MRTALGNPLADTDRLRILTATGLLDAGPVPSLDRLTRMAARLTGARLALVSLVDADRQRFASGCGLPPRLEREMQTPLSHSFCQYVVIDEAPLIIEDARIDDRLHGNLSITDYQIIAYAGFPLRAPNGMVLGSFCVTDDKPRTWSEEDLATVRDLAAAAESEIALRLLHGEQLLASARMQSVLDSAYDAYVSLDAGGDVVAWNAAAERLFGYAAAEALGRPVAELIVPERFREMHRAGLARVRESGQSLLTGQRLQLAAVDRTGREFPIEMTIQVAVEQGELVSHAFLHDITDRMIATKELERRRQEIEDDRTFLQALLDSLDTGVAACDSRGELAFFNRALRQVHGSDAGPGRPGETWSQQYGLYAEDGHTLVPADEVPLARAFTGEVVEGQTLVVPAPDGTPRRFLTNARPIDTPDGRRLGAVAAMHEVTEAHHAEVLRRTRHAVDQVLSEATNAEQAAIRAVVAVADSLGWMCGEYWQVAEDRRHIVRLSSHTAAGRELPGFTGDEPLEFGRGEGLAGLVWRTGADIWGGPESMSSGRAEAARQAGIRTVVGLPVRAGRRVLGVLAFFLDTDLRFDPDIADVLDTIGAHLGRFVERRRAEDLQLALASAQQELDRMKDELTALVIHELRNPIGVIRGYMETLLESAELAETDRRYAGVVDRNAEHLQRLVDDLLDLARLDAGHLSIDPRPMSAGRLLRDVIENHRPNADGKRLTVQARLEPHLPVHADGQRLRQALDNLLSNAIKYTPEGGRITVTAETGGDGVTIEISDTGIGIPAEQYPQLFSRFFRASNASREGIKGTGLGLAVTKAIIEAHQGTLAARPAHGGGTTFTVTLPAVDA